MRYFSMYPLILAVAACVGVVDACSGGDVKLDDHSANGHRREAAGERAMAKSEAAQYDPSAEQVQQVQAGGQQIPDVNTPILVTVNPTEAHLVAAEAHKRHAEQHENAAKKLIAFENAACKKVPTEDKLACPTLLHDTMQPLANGLRMHTGVDADAQDVGDHAMSFGLCPCKWLCRRRALSLCDQGGDR